jgi:hypothetical protein
MLVFVLTFGVLWLSARAGGPWRRANSGIMELSWARH